MICQKYSISVEIPNIIVMSHKMWETLFILLSGPLMIICIFQPFIIKTHPYNAHSTISVIMMRGDGVPVLVSHNLKLCPAWIEKYFSFLQIKMILVPILQMFIFSHQHYREILIVLHTIKKLDTNSLKTCTGLEILL